MDRNTCHDCGRPVASADDWRRAAANDAAGGDPEAPWAVALCWGAGNNCEAVSARDRIAALEAEVATLRRERDEARARLAKVGEAMECAGNRWDEWGTRAETVGEMLHDALSGSVGEGVR